MIYKCREMHVIRFYLIGTILYRYVASVWNEIYILKFAEINWFEFNESVSTNPWTIKQIATDYILNEINQLSMLYNIIVTCTGMWFELNYIQHLSIPPNMDIIGFFMNGYYLFTFLISHVSPSHNRVQGYQYKNLLATAKW